MQVLATLHILDEMGIDATMVEVKPDGLVIDGKFVCSDYFAALFRGATLQNIDILGPLYDRN